MVPLFIFFLFLHLTEVSCPFQQIGKKKYHLEVFCHNNESCCSGAFHRTKVAACAKHYLGDGGTTDGINENNTQISRHGLLSTHMPGYYNSIIKGVSTIMVSYSSWNGVKMHANRDMVTGFLKNILRFRVKRFP